MWIISFTFKHTYCIKIPDNKILKRSSNTRNTYENATSSNGIWAFSYTNNFLCSNPATIKNYLNAQYVGRLKVGMKSTQNNSRKNKFNMNSLAMPSLGSSCISRSIGNISETRWEVRPDNSPIKEYPLKSIEHSSKLKSNNIFIDKSVICSMPLDEYIVVGVIKSTHGLKGQLNVRSYSKNPQIRLCEPGYRFIKFPFNDERVIPIKLLEGRLIGLKDRYLIKLEGIDTVDQASRMIGAYITIPLREIPPLDENTYYYRDLINLTVYLYNDVTKTKLGTIVGYIHRSDFTSHSEYTSITEDLLEVEMDMRISLKTLIDITRNTNETKGEPVATKPFNIVTDKDLEEAEIVDAEQELENTYMQGVHYIKYYVCSTCNRQFTNHSRALAHDRIHYEDNNTERIGHNGDLYCDETIERQKCRIISLEEILQGRIKRPIRRFYIPLVRDTTIKYIDVPNKSIYVDPLSIFIGEDGTQFQSVIRPT